MSRTSSIPKYLTRDLFTANFWEEVDRVTIGILDLLLPMINFVGELKPGARALPLTEVHQQLHKIVAEAGWLANGLALTRSCFWIDFPQPGQLWDVRQEHVTDVMWRASKDFADLSDGQHLQRNMTIWRRARAPVYDALADNPKPTLFDWSRNTYEINNPRPRPPRRTAKVQISMWPFFERSYPYRQELVYGDFNMGETTTLLQKAQVVYYAGDDADAGEQREDYTLKQYLEDYNRRNALFWGPRARYSWPITLVLISLILYFAGPSMRAGYNGVRLNHRVLPNSVLPDWGLPAWGWPSLGWPSTRGGQDPHNFPRSGLPTSAITAISLTSTSSETSTTSSQSTESSSSSQRTESSSATR